MPFSRVRDTTPAALKLGCRMVITLQLVVGVVDEADLLALMAQVVSASTTMPIR